METNADQQFVIFLQIVLPRLGLRWPGYRKVRNQVRKRVNRRIRELGLANLQDYLSFLNDHQDEWSHLDSLCRITISRFYRDRSVFNDLTEKVLPELVEHAANLLRCWSCGCASGEEPYSLALIWQLALAGRFKGLAMEILATDSDPFMLERAKEACYPASSLRELPVFWREEAFTVSSSEQFYLKEEFKKPVSFSQQDLRAQAPEGLFHLIFCRNLAFTYFDQPIQELALARLAEHLEPGGALVVGCHEKLPPRLSATFKPWNNCRSIFRKVP